MTEQEAPNSPATGTPANIYRDGSYLSQNPTWDVEDSPWKAKQIATMLKRHDLSPSSICEVGCGAGEILRQLSNAFPNARLSGYELSPQAFSLCKQRETESIKYYLENLIEQDVHCECLLCIDVFEHVEDYFGFIKGLRSKAVYKIFHIPLEITVSSILRSTLMNARKKVGHLHYFTRETALATLTDCGYEIVDSFYTKPFEDLPAKTLRTRVAKLPRKILFAAFPHLAARLVGGCSLLVLTR